MTNALDIEHIPVTVIRSYAV